MYLHDLLGYFQHLSPTPMTRPLMGGLVYMAHRTSVASRVVPLVEDAFVLTDGVISSPSLDEAMTAIEPSMDFELLSRHDREMVTQTLMVFGHLDETTILDVLMALPEVADNTPISFRYLMEQLDIPQADAIADDYESLQRAQALLGSL